MNLGLSYKDHKFFPTNLTEIKQKISKPKNFTIYILLKLKKFPR